MNTQARKLFRILAGLIALLASHALLDNGALVFAGSYKHLLVLIVGLIFVVEFGSIAIRGDGLWLYRAARFKNQQSKKSNRN